MRRTYDSHDYPYFYSACASDDRECQIDWGGDWGMNLLVIMSIIIGVIVLLILLCVLYACWNGHRHYDETMAQMAKEKAEKDAAQEALELNDFRPVKVD